MKSDKLLTLCLCATCASAFADITWPGTAGGDIDVAANWGGTLPSSSEMAFFSTVQTGPLTLHGDGLTFYRLKLDAPGTNVFDLGAGKSALASHRIFFKGGTTLHLKSGTMGVAASGDRIFMGDDQNSGTVFYGSNTLIVDGPASVFRSAGTASSSDGNNFIGLGINNANNTILVCNGGTLEGAVRIGSNQKYSTNNILRVTGAGSSFTGVSPNRRFEVGAVGGWNLAEFLDGATMTAPGAVTVGNFQLINNDQKLGYWHGPCNTLRLSGAGTTGTVDGDIQIGFGNSSNRLEVLDGAVLEANSRVCVGMIGSNYPQGLASNPCHNVFYVAPGGCVRHFTGSRSNSRNILIGDAEGATGNVLRVCGDYSIMDAQKVYSYIGVSGPESRIEIDGGRMVVTNAGAFHFGRGVSASGCGLHVSNGGYFEHYLTNGYFYLYCGYDGPNCHVNVDNSVLRLKTADGLGTAVSVIYIGYNSQSAAHSSLSCVNGGLVEAGRMIVGAIAPNCELAVTNASVRLTGALDVGYSNTAPLPTNCVVRLAGTNATVVAQGTFRIRNNSRLEYSFPAEGTIASPVITCDSLDTQYGNGLVIAVNVEKGVRNHKRTVELIRANSNISDTNYNRLSFSLGDGVTIERTSNAIIARIASNKGMLISFR